MTVSQATCPLQSWAGTFALPNKIALTQEQYFIVQSIYRGWALFALF
jgi:hypothetical protein